MVKPELTEELRIRFLAQYPMCSCIIRELSTDGITYIETQDKIEGFDFTRNEIIAERVNWCKPTIIIPLLKDPNKLDLDDEQFINSLNPKSPEEEDFYTFYGLDYLRSKNYAIPFMSLTVQELIAIGWIKLI